MHQNSPDRFPPYLDEPRNIRHEEAYQSARDKLATAIRSTPEESLDAEDTIDLDLFLGTRAAFVHTLLLNSSESERAEEEGIVDIELRAPFSNKVGRILTANEVLHSQGLKDTVLTLSLGKEWSESLLTLLTPNERIAALRYAYSCREQELYKKIKKGLPGMLKLQARHELLEDRLQRVIERISNT